jgi:hypothetical protein
VIGIEKPLKIDKEARGVIDDRPRVFPVRNAQVSNIEAAVGTSAPPSDDFDISLHIEFLAVLIEHKLVACDERNVQQAPSAKESLAWDAFDQSVTFELPSPDGHEVLALTRQLGARLGKIICRFA